MVTISTYTSRVTDIMTNVNRSSQQLVDHMGRFGYTIGDLNDNRDVYVNDRDEYTVYGNVSYVGSHEHSPLKITHVYGDFKCNGNQFITSGINCPSYVSGEVWFDFTLIDNDTIGMLPNHIGGSLWLNNTKITSLRGIHERVNYIGQGIYFSSGVTHLLGILKIEGITRIGVDTDNVISKLFEDRLEDRDIVLLQDQLIDHGYVEEGKL